MKRAAQWLVRNWLASILFMATALLAAVAVAIGLSLNSAHPKQVPFEAAKALATLATGLLLGGVLKLITDNHAERKRDQDERPKHGLLHACYTLTTRWRCAHALWLRLTGSRRHR